MLTLPEVAQRTGIPRSTISRWITAGYLRPTVQAHGKGDANQFDDVAVARCRAVAAIVDAFGDGALTRIVIEKTLPGVTATTRAIQFSTELALA